MKVKVYIDGQEGTTGLKILERFAGRRDIALLEIDEEKRKDTAERKRLINASDFTFLCLPDDAAREAVALCENPNTRIIDASTAHRTLSDWTYGFPELFAGQREKIAQSKRVAVPGCYASGFAACVVPLVKSGIIAPDHAVICHAVSGYSGAGKKAIAVYGSEQKTDEMFSPRQYALTQQHKHLKEMKAICGLDYLPIFNPIVDDFFSGMTVSVPLAARTLAKRVTAQELRTMYADYYAGQFFISVAELNGTDLLPDGFLAANTLSGTNRMELFVCADPDSERILIAARLDNLGKGASGAAVQCMNIMMGIDERTGLV
ncbi:MAG: N-acetyl-gamma-glutamyl-phosphate reductase [Oscillospiraceae bacterium]